MRDKQQGVSGATHAQDAAEARESRYVQSVERAAALLRAVATATGAAATATALAERVGLNRTTTWRILTTLEQQQLVFLDRTTGRYSLGFGLIDLAGQAAGASMATTSQTVVRRIARRIGETVALAVPRPGGLTYVAEASDAGNVVSVAWQGRPVPLHATSTGKVLLAFSDEEEVEELLGEPERGGLPRFTPATITSRAQLAAELARTRKRGFSVCRGEFEPSAWGVSAPVLDVTGRPIAVLSIWGPPERINAKRFAELGALAVEGAAQIAGRATPVPA